VSLKKTLKTHAVAEVKKRGRRLGVFNIALTTLANKELYTYCELKILGLEIATIFYCLRIYFHYQDA
jgi:acyl-coenzyme A thioesterase PaaI-like protein